jgi:PEGA domain
MARTNLALSALTLVAFLALGSQQAFAQDEAQTKQAAALKQEGADAFARKDWTAALQKFDEAYALSKDPAFLFNRARTLEAMEDLPRAVDAIEEFDKLASVDLKGKVVGLAEITAGMRNRVAVIALKTNVASAEIRINDRVVQKTVAGVTKVRVTRASNVRVQVSAEGYYPCLREVKQLAPGEEREEVCELNSQATRGLLVVQSTTGASIKVDGVPRGNVPFEGDLTAGPHEVELSMDGYETARPAILIEVSKTKRLSVDLAKKAGIASKWWFWTGIGAVLIGGGIATYVLTRPGDPTPGSIKPGVIATGLSF